MSSFIATAPLAPPASSADATVANDGWFPDIDLKDLRETMRLDGTVTQERLRAAAVDAMATINEELGAWQAMQRRAGCAALEGVPSANVDNVSAKVMRYRRAVYHQTRADLTEQYRSFDATKSGSQHAEDLDLTICESRRNVRWALADIRGVPRSTVELI